MSVLYEINSIQIRISDRIFRSEFSVILIRNLILLKQVSER